ncbi:MAG: rhomboid family intramembrane serine protease [Trebonia sp.]|jgi:membrane associated rhomboid family serine protease
MTVHKLRDAVVVMAGFLALIWALQVFNWADGYRLDSDFAILPQHLSRLPDIFTAPFLHAGWQHIEGNSLPLFVLGVLAAYRSIARFLLVSLIAIVTSGLAVWLFQPSNEPTVGASGLIFGYFGYVLVRGFLDRNLIDIGVGAVAGVLYWTILQVALPGTPGVSWIGHLGGLAGGVIAAWVVRSRPSVSNPRPRPAVDGWSPGGRPSAPAGAPTGTRTAGTRPAGARTGGSKSADDLLRELKQQGF